MRVVTGRLVGGHFAEAGGDGHTVATVDIAGRLNVPLGGYVGFLVMEHGDPSMKTEEIERLLNSRLLNSRPVSARTSAEGSKGKSSGEKR